MQLGAALSRNNASAVRKLLQNERCTLENMVSAKRVEEMYDEVSVYPFYPQDPSVDYSMCSMELIKIGHMGAWVISDGQHTLRAVIFQIICSMELQF
jgi:hypothetical protein